MDVRNTHCAVTWTCKLSKLKTSAGLADASAAIKEWNSMATRDAALTGGKRTAVLSLLNIGDAALGILLDYVSTVGPDNSIFTDDCWGNKKVLPGWEPKGMDTAWSRRLSISDESFRLMLQRLISGATLGTRKKA